MFLAYRIDTEFNAIQNIMLIHCYFNHLIKILCPSLFDTISEINISLPSNVGCPTLAAFLFLRLWGPQRQVFVVGVN